MLIVSRKTDESITISLEEGTDESVSARDLFANGPITITLLSGGSGRRIKVGIEAPERLTIRRRDAVARSADPQT